MLFQRSWSEIASRNDVLPETAEQFKAWIEEEKTLELLQILMRVLTELPDTTRNYTLGIFTVASEQAMTAAIYIVQRGGLGAARQAGGVYCTMSKLTLKQTQSIPRSELAAVLLGARLLEAVQQLLLLIPYDTGSTVAVANMESNPGRLDVFVANIVAQIQELVEVRVWNQVPGTENPVDLAARHGSSHIGDFLTWWNYQDWITNSQYFLLQEQVSLKTLPTQKRNLGASTILHGTRGLSVLPIDRIVGLMNRSRAIKLVLRLFRSGSARRANLDAILRIRWELQCYHGEEYAVLSNSLTVGAASNIKKLNPFICPETGLIRVGGRLMFSDTSSGARDPIIVLRKAALAMLLVHHIHLRLCHAGTGPVRVELRYCITGDKSLIRHMLHACVRCIQFYTRLLTPLLGDLPAARVQSSPPFSQMELGYASPFMVLLGFGEKDINGKMCLLVVCFVTQVVHLDDRTHGTTTNDTLEAPKRVMARHGVPRSLFNDNGAGLPRQFNKMSGVVWDEATGRHLLDSGIHWRAIPLAGPHTGGLWEAAVKSENALMKRSFGMAKQTSSQLHTVICEVGVILKSRSLVPLVEPDELQTLTTSVLLTGFKNELFPVLPGEHLQS